MIKKVIILKKDLDEEMARETAKACNEFPGLVMIETGKRTVNGSNERALLKTKAMAGERIRLVLEGESGEEETFNALKTILEG